MFCPFAVSFGMVSNNMFYYSQNIAKHFLEEEGADELTFQGVASIGDVWAVSARCA